jgi:uncharacterized membrane protein
MIAICFALVSAVAYGASDFAGGLASRRLHFTVVNVVGQFVSTVLLSGLLLAAGDAPSLAGCAWGAIGGLGSGIGSLALYRGLAGGRMAVVAPLSAGVAAVVPVGFGALLGSNPSLVATVGVLIALPAIVLISMTGGAGRGALSASARDGVLAGVGFAVLFIALSRSGDRVRRAR